jgi:GNAT superfamily N-acetyltransferase
MLPNLLIRPVELKDAAEICENLFSQDTLEKSQARLVENLQKAAQGQILHIVAEFEGEVVGTAVIIRNPHPLRAHRAEVADLVVKYELWGKGIARQLIQESKKLAVEMGITILEIGCRGGEPAEQVYTRLGFIEYSRLPDGLVEPWGEKKGYDDVLLYQPLNNELRQA